MSLYENAAANTQRRVLPPSVRRANRMRILLNRVHDGRATAADRQELDTLTSQDIEATKARAVRRAAERTPQESGM